MPACDRRAEALPHADRLGLEDVGLSELPAGPDLLGPHRPVPAAFGHQVAGRQYRAAVAMGTEAGRCGKRAGHGPLTQVDPGRGGEQDPRPGRVVGRGQHPAVVGRHLGEPRSARTGKVSQASRPKRPGTVIAAERGETAAAVGTAGRGHRIRAGLGEIAPRRHDRRWAADTCCSDPFRCGIAGGGNRRGHGRRPPVARQKEG